MNQRQYDRVTKDFDEAIKLDPNQAGTLNNRGQAYLSKHDYDRAIEDFNEAIRLDPRLAPAALLNLADAYNQKGDYGGAVSRADQAIKLNPTSVPALVNRGWAYMNKRQYDAPSRTLTKRSGSIPHSRLPLSTGLTLTWMSTQSDSDPS